MISPSTICYALKMTYDFLRSEYLCERTECNRKRLEEFSDAVDEIDNGTLEIEGYERATWTKFDVDNPKTHPEGFEKVLLSIDGIIACGTWKFILVAKWRGAEKIYWRPLPKPPVETEEAK